MINCVAICIICWILIGLIFAKVGFSKRLILTILPIATLYTIDVIILGVMR